MTNRVRRNRTGLYINGAGAWRCGECLPADARAWSGKDDDTTGWDYREASSLWGYPGKPYCVNCWYDGQSKARRAKPANSGADVRSDPWPM